EERFSQVKYKEPMLLFRYTGKSFENISAQSGPVFSRPFAARGMAVGDFNNDGSLDALVAVNNDAPLLLKNNAAKGNHWLGVRLVGRKANRGAVCFCLLCLGMSLEPQSASQKGNGPNGEDQPVLRVSTRLVEVSVVVENRKGEPVRDLGRDDFTVLDDGREQQISVFSVESEQ